MPLAKYLEDDGQYSPQQQKLQEDWANSRKTYDPYHRR